MTYRLNTSRSNNWWNVIRLCNRHIKILQVIKLLLDNVKPFVFIDCKSQAMRSDVLYIWYIVDGRLCVVLCHDIAIVYWIAFHWIQYVLNSLWLKNVADGMDFCDQNFFIRFLTISTYWITFWSYTTVKLWLFSVLVLLILPFFSVYFY